MIVTFQELQTCTGS